MGKSRTRKPGKRRRHATAESAQRQELSKLFAAAAQLHQQGKLEQAESLYKVVLKVEPHHSDALHLLGVLAHQVGHSETACELIGQAIALNPAVPQYHFNRGVSFQALERNDSAAASYRESVRLKPDYYEAYENLGVALQDMNEPEAANQAYRRALELNERSPISLHNLGSLLKNIGQTEEALLLYSRALALNPVYAEVHWKNAHALLALGRFEEGWKEYEWRFYTSSFLNNNAPRIRPFPKWDGSSLRGKRILIVPEQGIGDEIMFASCFRDVIDEAQSCVIECDPRLAGLFERSFTDAEIVPVSPGCAHLCGIPPFDFRISAGSLPRFLRSSLDDYPVAESYLWPDPTRQEHWRNVLAPLQGAVNIGVSWRGGRERRAREARSIPLRAWQGIFDTEDANFINLQYGANAEEIAEARGQLHTLEGIDPLTDIEDLAALISVLDLVISVDNSTVHLAGALGTPVWALLPRSAEWRWLDDERSSSIWYASARLFRHSAPGPSAWDAVLDTVVEALRGCEFAPAARIDERAGPAISAFSSATPSDTRGVQALLLNDTSSWYHWGCTCTSIAIHDQLRRRWNVVESVPITNTTASATLPQTIDDFDDHACFSRFAAAQRDLVHRMEHCDAIYINGEGTLHNVNPQALSLLYMAYVAKTRLGKPVHIINHSCYPDDAVTVSDSPACKLYQKVYAQVDRVAVREAVSARLLAKMGIEATTSFDCLPLFVEKHYRPSEKGSHENIVIAGSVAWRAEALPAIGEFMKRMRSEGFEIQVLIGADAYPAADDFRFVEALHSSFCDSFTLVNAMCESTWLDTIANAALLVSGRFHHSIAAAFLDTPFIVLESNTPKIAGLMEMLSLQTTASVSDVGLAATLVERARRYIADPAPALVSDAKKASLRALSLKNFE